MTAYGFIGLAAMALVLVYVVLSLFGRSNNTLSWLAGVIVFGLATAGLRYALHH
jgi:hypothetical protein